MPGVAEAGAEIDYVESTVDGAVAAFGAGGFDLVYTGIGVEEDEQVAVADGSPALGLVVGAEDQAVGLIEVMKTFSRLHYGGEGLPTRARVRVIVVKDEEDVAAGDTLFELDTAD